MRDRLAAASLARLNAPDPETFQADARFALDALPALTTRPDQIKQLRQTILNLAVRGKLVPQDPNDEPASELLKRIATRASRTAKPCAKLGLTQLSQVGGDDMPFDCSRKLDAGRAFDAYICKVISVTRSTATANEPTRRAFRSSDGQCHLPGGIDFTGRRLSRTVFESPATSSNVRSRRDNYSIRLSARRIVGMRLSRSSAFWFTHHQAILDSRRAMSLRSYAFLRLASHLRSGPTSKHDRHNLN